MLEFSFTSSGPGAWRDAPWHRSWLTKQANILFDLFDPIAINPRGGFFDLDPTGKPLTSSAVRPIHTTARAVHCYVIASLLGRPGSDRMIDHGMQYLWHSHRDSKHGGYMWSLDDEGPKDASKQGYGHAFVLLAASSAKLVGHPLADRMLADVTTILNDRFWEEQHGAITEEFERDWTPVRGYRGQNSNMHLTEALMAAYEATADHEYLRKAECIADLIINRRARECGFRVAEHFDEQWAIDRSYKAVNEMFRPSGTTPGHWLEWARLALQLWVLGGKKHDWMPAAAEMLFRRSVELAWDGTRGGFFYTLDWADKPSFRFKPWWPIAEAAGAASFLAELRPSAFHEEWYRRIWNTIAEVYIDREHGGWFEELDAELQPAHSLFVGKADLYHALQACLIPLYPAQGSLTNVVRQRYEASPTKTSMDGDV